MSVTASNAPVFNTTNYMVPANGTTHCVQIQGTVTAAPSLLDWRQFTVDNFPFQPQGVYIDNTAGTATLSITVVPLGWTINCPAGQQLATSFPAPNGETMTVVGNGQVSMAFVDFPVLPSQALASIAGTVNVNIASPNPLPVLPPPLTGGVPYRDQEYVPAAEYHAASITGATTTVSIVPTLPSQNLRKLSIYLTGDAAMAAAGENTLTVQLNGNTIFLRKFYLPNAAPAAPIPGYTLCELNADMIGLAAAAGNLTVTLATALSVGELDINAYLTPQ